MQSIIMLSDVTIPEQTGKQFLLPKATQLKTNS